MDTGIWRDADHTLCAEKFKPRTGLYEKFQWKANKTSIVGTWAIRGPGGISFWYFAPDKTMRFFSSGRDRLNMAVIEENTSSATYTASGTNVVVQMSPDSLPIAGRLELNDKLIVGGNGSPEQGLLKISDKLLEPNQMAQFVNTGAIAGNITNDQFRGNVDEMPPQLL